MWKWPINWNFWKKIAAKPPVVWTGDFRSHSKSLLKAMQTRKNCWGNIVAFPWMLPRFWIRETMKNVSEFFSETLCFRSKCFLRAQMGRHCCVNILRNVFATMFPRWLLEKTRNEGKPTKAPDVEWNMPSTNQITARACWIQLLRAYAREMFSRTENCLASGAVLKAERYSKRLKK